MSAPAVGAERLKESNKETEMTQKDINVAIREAKATGRNCYGYAYGSCLRLVYATRNGVRTTSLLWEFVKIDKIKAIDIR